MTYPLFTRRRGVVMAVIKCSPSGSQLSDVELGAENSESFFCEVKSQTVTHPLRLPNPPARSSRITLRVKEKHRKVYGVL